MFSHRSVTILLCQFKRVLNKPIYLCKYHVVSHASNIQPLSISRNGVYRMLCTERYSVRSMHTNVAFPPNLKSDDLYFTNVANQLKYLTHKTHSAQLNRLFVRFLDTLNEKRLEIKGDTEWNEFVSRTHKKHPLLLDICHLDPFTKRCFDKPRGYSGDAVTLDMIYGKEKPAQTSILGEAIFECLIDHIQTTAAVRDRANFIGRCIDGLYVKKAHPLNVLSIACGHLRELEASKEFWSGNINVVGFDQDEESLARVRKDYVAKGYNVSTVKGKIKDLFNSKYGHKFMCDTNYGNKFDLIWSAGLYDYLNDKSCELLTSKLFDLVKPGGKLLIANFMQSDAVIQGYMECFMDWKLIYRNIKQVQKCTNRIDKHKVSCYQIHELQAIAFIEITKSEH